MVFNGEVVLATCRDTTPLQKRIIVENILHHTKVPPPEVGAGEALCLWTFDMLRRDTKLEDTALLAIVNEYHGAIEKFGNTFSAAHAARTVPTGRLPAYRLAIGDDTYVVADGVSGFLALADAVRYDKPGQFARKTVVYELGRLYADMLPSYESECAHRKPRCAIAA